MFLKQIYNMAYNLGLYYAMYVAALTGATFASLLLVFRSLKNGVTPWSYPKRRELPPKILNDEAYGQHSYIQIQNVKLHYVENGDKNKPLMLFLHGFPDFWFSWREQIKHYSKYYRTVAVDLRGYGESEKLSGYSSYQIKYLIEDVKNFIEALGCRKCILVGHDWGGVVEFSFIRRYPEMVDKYVVVNAIPTYAAKVKFAQLLKSWYTYFFQLPLLPEIFMQFNDLEIFDLLYEKSGEDVVNAYKFTFGKPGAFTCPINYYRANMMAVIKSSVNTLASLEDVKFPPGYLMYGSKDKYLDKSTYENIGVIPNLKSECVQGEGHFFHQYKPKLFNDLVDEFLNIPPPPPATDASTTDERQKKSLLPDDGGKR